MCSMGLWKTHSVIGTKASGQLLTRPLRSCQYDLPTTLHTLVVLDQPAYLEDVFLTNVPPTISELSHCQHYESAFSGTQGVLKILLRTLLQHAHATPHRCGADARRISGHHQQLGLVRLQLLGRRGRLRPPREPTLGKALLRKPITLAVIRQNPNLLPASV